MSHPSQQTSRIVETVTAHFPTVQGIYLFGSHAAGAAWPDSDVDLALLLPPTVAADEPCLAAHDCRFALEDVLGAPVDLVNARSAPTVLQKEILRGQLLAVADAYAVAEFEMLTLSYYEKLNEERAEALAVFAETGEAYRT